MPPLSVNSGFHKKVQKMAVGLYYFHNPAAFLILFPETSIRSTQVLQGRGWVSSPQIYP